MTPEQNMSPEATAWQAPEPVEATADKQTERRKQDMAHRVNSKGWHKYWLNRLKDEVDLPQDVHDLVAGVHAEKPEDQGRQQRAFNAYVRDRQTAMSSSSTEIVEQVEPDAVKEEASAPDLHPNTVRMEELKRDGEHYTSKKGWREYWCKRLAPERETLTEQAKAYLVGDRSREVIEGFTAFVTNRLKEAKLERAVLSIKEEDRQFEEMLASSDLTPERVTEKREAAEVARLREDDKHGLQTGKYLEYWHPRVVADEETPDDVLNAFKNQGMPENQKIIAQYVNERLSAQSFVLARHDEREALHGELERIDRGEDYPPRERIKRREIGFDEETEEMFVIGPDGERNGVTEGDITADLMWGVKYRPTSAMPEWQWRRIRELSAIREAKDALADIRNREIASKEGVSLPTTSLSPEYLEQHHKTGVIAERMAQSVLVRLQNDHPEFCLKLEQSNALEDAVLKYDFKVVFTDRRRGVALAGQDGREAYVAEKQRLGLQFTVDTTTERLQHKEKQLRKANVDKSKERYKKFVDHTVDDIVLVVVELDGAKRAFEQWLAAGKPTGGPEQYLTKREISALLEGITAKVPGFDRKQLNQMVEALER
jgi:hypothetical protein